MKIDIEVHPLQSPGYLKLKLPKQYLNRIKKNIKKIVKNKNTSCPHHGSMGIVDKVMDLPNAIGKVAVYTVTNDGMNYSPGDKLTKTIDQLEPVDEKFTMNVEIPNVDKDDID